MSPVYVIAFCLRNWCAAIDGICFCVVKIVICRFNVNVYRYINYPLLSIYMKLKTNSFSFSKMAHHRQEVTYSTSQTITFCTYLKYLSAVLSDPYN